jgi:hypothetical protein
VAHFSTVGVAQFCIVGNIKEVFPSAAKTDAIDARKGLELFTLSDHLPLAKNCLQRIEKPDQINIKLKRYSRRRRRLVDEKVRDFRVKS